VQLILAVLAVPLGVAMAFLGAETADATLLLMIPVAVIIRQGAPARLPALVILFGVGFLAGASYFAAGTEYLTSAGLIAYAASQVAVGVALIALGLVLRFRSRPT
jgi:hypothetical protein